LAGGQRPRPADDLVEVGIGGEQVGAEVAPSGPVLAACAAGASKSTATARSVSSTSPARRAGRSQGCPGR